MKKLHGFIARLPHELRSEIHARLAAGESTQRVLSWLNRHPAVTALLHAAFEGRPVSEQDLSEWRREGSPESRSSHDSLADAQAFAERSVHVAALGIDSGHLVADLTVRYAGLLHQWGVIPELEFNRQLLALQRLTTSILAVRKTELKVARLELDRERLAFSREKNREKAASSPVSCSRSNPGADQSIERQPKTSPSSTPSGHSNADDSPPPSAFPLRSQPIYRPSPDAPQAHGAASLPLDDCALSWPPGAPVPSR